MSSVRRNWQNCCHNRYSTRRDCATPTGSAGQRTARTRMPLPPRKPAPAGKPAPGRGEAARRPQDEIGGGHHAGILRVWDRSFLQNLLSGGIPAGAFTSRVRDRARETGYSRRNGLSRPPPLKIRKAPSSATSRNSASMSRDRRAGASGTGACRGRLQFQIMIEKYRRVNSPGGSGKRTDLDRRPEQGERPRPRARRKSRAKTASRRSLPERRTRPTAEAGRTSKAAAGRTGILTPRRRAALSSRSFSRRGRSSDRPFPPGRLPSP